MKKIYKFIALVLFTSAFVACEEDLIIYDVDNGQNALSFARSSQIVDFCVGASTVTVESTTRSAADRTYNINVDAAGTTALPSEYTVASSVTIPAGEFIGTTPFDVDFAAIPVGESRTVTLDLVTPEGTVLNTRGTTVVGFSSACTLNEVTINYTADGYPAENSLRLVNTTTNEVFIDVAEGGFSADISFPLCLPNGDYVLTIGDPGWGDGFGTGGSVTGDAISCSGNSELFSDVTGNFGFSTTRAFSF